MSWFDDQGFVDRSERRAARTGTGPENYAMGGTMQPATPMTPGQAGAALNDPTNARVSGSQGGTQRYSDQALQEIFNRYPPTNEGFKAAAAEADRVFGAGTWGKYLDHPQRLDKVQLADGRVIDMIGGAGGPNPSWGWMVEGPGHGGAAGTLGAMAGGNWQAGMDPSYGFIKDEATKALQSGAAARGTLLTGGFQKDMAKYIAGLASTEYGNIFGRNLSLANLGLNAAGQAAGVGSAYSGQAGNLTANQVGQNNELYTGMGNARAGATAGNAVLWGNTIADLGGQNAGALSNLRDRWLKPAKGDWSYRPPITPPAAPQVPGVGPGTFPGWWEGTADGDPYSSV